MHGLHIAVQLLAQGKELLRALLEVLAGMAMSDVQCLLQLLQEMCLGDLVGMKFQTERVETNLGQTFLHDLQRGHLLCHE